MEIKSEVVTTVLSFSLLFSLLLLMWIAKRYYDRKDNMARMDALGRFAFDNNLTIVQNAANWRVDGEELVDPDKHQARLQEFVSSFDEFGSFLSTEVEFLMIAEQRRSCFYAMERTTQSTSSWNISSQYEQIFILWLPIDLGTINVRYKIGYESLSNVLLHSAIEFESAEFNDLYFVSSSDPRLAYDLFHPQMIDLFCEKPFSEIEIKGSFMVTRIPGRLNIDDLSYNHRQMTRFVNLIPEYLWRDRGPTQR